MSEVFEEHRSLLFGIAYRMLGSVTDAEDVVQDAWLRWNSVTGAVDNPRAYLARTVSNLSLNRLRTTAALRENYVGPWLPEPLVTEPDATEQVELAESISLAMLVVLESLSPLERAVFVLHEVFDFAYADIAAMLDRSEVATRQVGHRARSHVQARRPRYDTSDDVRRRVTEEFMAACFGGDLNAMLELLAPEVTAWTDGGGKAQAALRPIHGGDKVARWILGVLSRLGEAVDVIPVSVNGQPGVMAGSGGRVDSVATLDVADGKIAAIHLIRNPDKLSRIRLGAR